MTKKLDFSVKYAPSKPKDLIGSQRQIYEITKWLDNFKSNAKKNIEKNNDKKNKKNKKFKDIIIPDNDNDHEEEFIDDEEIQSNITFIKNNKLEESCCLCLTGDNGTGKTSIIKTILENKNYYIKKINFSDINIIEKPDIFVDTIFSYNIISDDEDNINKEKVILIDDIQNANSQIEKKIISLIIAYNDLYWHCPIVFIGSNKHKKIISIVKKECYNVPIYPPTNENMISLLEKICNGEKMKFENEEVPKRILEYCNNDYKKLIIILEELYRIYKRTVIKLIDLNKNIDLMGIKDSDKSLFENTIELIGNYKNIETSLRIFETDKSALPLMIQQNHFGVMTRFNKKNNLETLMKITESLSYGDVVENFLYSEQNWTLQQTCGYYYCVMPSYLFDLNIDKQKFMYETRNSPYNNLKFTLGYPKDFNKTSTRCINYKNIKNVGNYFNGMTIYDYLMLIKIIKKLLEKQRYEECRNLLKKYNLTEAIITYVIKIDKIIENDIDDKILKKIKFISPENYINNKLTKEKTKRKRKTIE